MLTYTNRGDVRGSCGHKHRTLSGALRCLEDDRRWCRRVGGYSDRYVRPSGAVDEDELADQVAALSGRL